jgi:hypothetical protein
MRFLLVAIVVIFAVGAAKAVDHLANRVPVSIANIQWTPQDRSCLVTFRLHNRTLSPKTAVVFVTLYAAPEANTTSRGERKDQCGSTAERVNLRPLESRTLRVAVPTSKKPVDCDVVLEETAR